MLAKKLLVRPGSRVAVIGAPPTIDLVLPPDAKPSERGPADIILVYARDRAALGGALAKATKRVAESGVLWVAYPKAGQLGTDLNRDILARALQAEGLEPVTQIAVDDVWSALRVKRDAALSAARKARGAFAEKPKPARGKAKAKPKAKAKSAGTKSAGTKSATRAKKKSAAKTKSVRAGKGARARRRA
ncbi:MAG: DUF3052 family protein [Labilithrix sp.]|nr:DUF3052 family protein [Labilithrix sp.]